MKQLMNGLIALVTVSAFFAGPAEAQPRGRYNEPTFRVQLGEFRPDGDSVYWDDKAFDFTGRAEDFEDTMGSVSYLHPLGPKLSLLVSGFFYEGTESQAYLAFEDEFGADILHTTELELNAFTVGLHYKLTGPDAAVIPYVGAGGGLYVWRIAEFGDFIDFGTADLEIFDDFFEQEDEDLGWYVTAGLEVPVADFWSLFAEARWDNAEGDLSGDFRGLGELDLSGRSYSAGLSWSF
ncbi:MAG: outer membrane protein [Thermoanaerobaculia bacterium]